MPYGGSSPEQDKKIEKCVKSNIAKGMDKVKAIKICKSSVMGKDEETQPKVTEGVLITLSSPVTIMEAMSQDNADQMRIAGMAVPAQESRNGRAYKIEDLSMARFKGKPYADGMMLNIGLNHSEDVTDNVGKWTPVFQKSGIAYEGVVFNTGKHNYMIDMLKKGLLDAVSVEMIADLVEEDGGVYAKNQDILGFDFVKHPGLSDVSVGIAEAFEKALSERSAKEKEQSASDIQEEKGDSMTKEEIVKEEEDTQEETTEEPAEEKSEEPDEKLDTLTKETEKSLQEMKKELSTLSEEVSKIKEAPKSKGKVTETSKPEYSIKTEKKSGKMSIWSEEFVY